MVELNADELLFNKANPEGLEKAGIELHYRLWETYPEPTRDITDSLTESIPVIKDNSLQRYLVSIPVKIRKGKKYIIRLYIRDILRESDVEEFIYADKTNPFNAQNFKVIESKSNAPVVTSLIGTDKLFRLHYNRRDLKYITVQYFSNVKSTPIPIFSSLTINMTPPGPDSIYLVQYSDSTQFQLNEKGMYHFLADTSSNEGLTLFNFGKDYPMLTTPDDLIRPLIYLTSSSEYKKMMEMENSKLAVDNFWYERTGNYAVARELLRAYYNRAQYANYYFTADREGWKTDRGMVYIVFGPPRRLYKTDNEETWVYFTKKGDPTLEMTFKRIENPYTSNMYMLQRDEYLDGFWKEAVETWRSGEPYTY